MPWWGAVLVAVGITAIRVALDSGDNELGGVFGSLYALGCVLAVLAVRQSGIFTAIIQPPMILFATVPGAYFLFHGPSSPTSKTRSSIAPTRWSNVSR